MSLVNDVLRQLETNNSKPYQGMPLQPLMAVESSDRSRWIHLSFLVLIAFLLIIISLQVFYKHSTVSELGSRDAMAPESTQMIAPVAKLSFRKKELPDDISSSEFKTVEKPLEHEKNAEIHSDILTEVLPISVSVASPIQESPIQESPIQESPIQRVDKAEYLESEPLRSEPVKPESVKYEPISQKLVDQKLISQKPIKPVVNVLAEEANITSVKNAGFKHYQLALRAYKQKNSEVALTWVNLALSEEPKEEYLRLKVRILMQQGLGNEIYRLAVEQASNKNLSWFELIAPSLQMYSFYELSNKYYTELINQQPNETKWQLAMALNYSKLGKDDRTITIYQNLLQSTLLTYRQKKWITSRLENMNPSEVAIYE